MFAIFVRICLKITKAHHKLLFSDLARGFMTATVRLVSGKQVLVSGKCPLQLSASVRVQGFSVRKLSAHLAEVWNVRFGGFQTTTHQIFVCFRVSVAKNQQN